MQAEENSWTNAIPSSRGPVLNVAGAEELREVLFRAAHQSQVVALGVSSVRSLDFRRLGPGLLPQGDDVYQVSKGGWNGKRPHLWDL